MMFPVHRSVISLTRLTHPIAVVTIPRSKLHYITILPNGLGKAMTLTY